MKIAEIDRLLGDDAEHLLKFDSPKVSKETLQLPGSDWVDRVLDESDRPAPVLESLKSMFDHGRLAGTGYLSILPVDQGIEHSAGASFAPNPMYFDPENIVKLAIEAGCSAVASTLGVLGSIARRLRRTDSVHRQDQSQRIAQLSQHLRPDAVTRGVDPGVRNWRGRGRGDRLFRLGRIAQADNRDKRSIRLGARDGHGHGPLVLPA